MENRYQSILNKVSLQYPSVNIGIIEEYQGIHLLYNDMDLIEDEVFFDFVCDVAYEHLVGEELNIFSIVYDYASQLDTNNIMPETYNPGRYNCKKGSNNFIFDFGFTQPLTSIDEGALAA